MKKNKGFTLVGTLLFLTMAIVMINLMTANQMSSLKYRKKRLQIIHQKIADFNMKVKELKNEGK
jgi:hypothetical protein